MHKNLKKINIIVLAILLLFSMTLFAACGNSQNNNTNNNQTTRPEQPVQPEQPTEPYSYRPHLSEKLPAIKINTADGKNDFATVQDIFYQKENGYWKYKKPEIPYTQATVSVDNCESAYQMQNVDAQVKIRGNSTAVYYKKPLRIKFNAKQSMLGLNNNYQAKDWVLLADWKDTSMLRNNIGFYLGQHLFKENGLYTSDFRNVEVYLNGEYWGVYLLCEQNEVGSGRIKINKPAEGYTGTNIGYLLEMDDYAEFEPELNRFYMNFNSKAKLVNDEGKNIMSSYVNTDYIVKSKIYHEQQRDFIASYLENVYRICYKAIVENSYYKFNADKTKIIEAPEITDVYTAVTNVVDIDSVVAMLILQEVVMDADITTSSFFMTVDLSGAGDGKLRFDVPWDFDSSFGWDAAEGVAKSDKLYAANSHNPWLVLFYKPEFIKIKVKDKWQDLKKHGVHERLLQYIDDCTNLYREAYAKNYAKWKNIGGNFKTLLDSLPADKRDNDNYKSSFTIIYWAVPDALQNCNTQEDAARYVKNWLQDRINALNAIWG